VNTPRYHVTYAKAAARALRRLDRPLQRRLADAIDLLGDDPRPHGTKALQGGDGLLRIRVGDYRIIYAVHDDQLLVLVATLGHRREVYRRL
jgi:mRNA interferase RelE/StbE